MRERQAAKTQISVRLSDELLNRLGRLAKFEHRNRSNMIEYILTDWLREAAVGIYRSRA